MIPQASPEHPETLSQLNLPAYHLIKSPLGQLEYTDYGQGEPILFVHGGHANCHDTLSHKGFDLQAYRLITPSRPGYGKTKLYANQGPEKSAALLVELLNHLSLRQVNVYGISAGGPTAIALAALFPNRVSKLILASAVSAPWLQPGDSTYQAAQRLFNPKWQGLSWALVRFFSRLLPGKMAKTFHAEFCTLPAQKLRKADCKALLSCLRKYDSGSGFLLDLDQHLKPSWLQQIRCPTLIVHSRYDNTVPFSHAEQAYRQISHAQLLALDNSWGHMLWLGEEAEATLAKIRSFLKAGPPTTPQP